MIRSFGDRLTEKIFLGLKDKEVSRFPADVLKTAQRKLDMLDYAVGYGDLAAPPANQLEKLKGNLTGFSSIRINDQWRIIFRWQEDGPHDVKITDYH